MELDWESKKYTYIICALLGMVFLYSLLMHFIQINDENNQVLKGQKTLGHYKLLTKNGPSPFKVDLLEIETNKTYKNVFISETCPDYQNVAVNKTYQLFKYANFQVKTAITNYSYEGLYEAVCAKVKKEINEDK